MTIFEFLCAWCQLQSKRGREWRDCWVIEVDDGGIEGQARVLLGLRDAPEQWVELRENRLRLVDDSSVETSSEDDGEQEEVEEEEGAAELSGCEQVSAARWAELESMPYEEPLLFYNQDGVKIELSWTGHQQRVIVLENVVVPEKKRGKGIFRCLLEECEAYCRREGRGLRVGEIESLHVMLSCWRRGYWMSAHSADSGCVTMEQMALLRDKERHQSFLIAINDLVTKGEVETAETWFKLGRKAFGGGALKGLDMNRALAELRGEDHHGSGGGDQEPKPPAALAQGPRTTAAQKTPRQEGTPAAPGGLPVTEESGKAAAALAQLLGDDLDLD